MSPFCVEFVHAMYVEKISELMTDLNEWDQQTFPSLKNLSYP